LLLGILNLRVTHFVIVIQYDSETCSVLGLSTTWTQKQLISVHLLELLNPCYV